MHGYYPFEITTTAKRPERLLTIFASVATPDSEELAESIEAYCDNKSPPDRIIVIGPNTVRNVLSDAIQTGKFAERVRAVTRYHDSPSVDPCYFDWKGDVSDCEHIEHLKRVGMTRIFSERGALLQTPLSHHYEKPSSKHSTQFLRIGNAMVSGAEIDFIAFCCLPHIPKDVKHFYCDTGAIVPIANSLNTLRKELGKRILGATVDSFGSYDGAAKFRFRNMSRAIILISATTSEGLAQHLSEKYQLPRDRMVTVFHLGHELSEGVVVCNLSKDENLNPNGIEPFPSYSAENCKLCDEESTLIRIAGDQFLTGDTTIEEVTLIAVDADDMQEFLQNTSGKGLVRANYSEDGTPATNEVFFDLEKLFDDGKMLGITAMEEQFKWIVDQETPASLTRILSLDDPASKKMASVIQKRIRDSIGEVPVISVAEVKANLEKYIEADGSTLVAASAIASGRNLLAISQILRKIQPNELITYVVGLARLPSSKELARIRKNVTYGQKHRKYGFHLIDSTALPLYGPSNQTSWAIESNLWSRVMRTCEDENARGIIKNRQEHLRLAGSKKYRGMDETLFWPSTSGQPLVLRPGFAFYKFPQPDKVSQADVFFTIVSVLHSLRLRDSSNRSLRQHEHVRRVISPRNFERFNDGVIQAALLRAAHPAELDYTTSIPFSEDMAQILSSIFEHNMGETGEASTEFLLALAMRKLRLRKTVIASLVEDYASAVDDPISTQLWQVIKDIHVE